MFQWDNLYLKIFHSLDHLLPEFQLKKNSDCWQSSNGTKLDGSSGKTGKVFIYNNNPSMIIDYTRGVKSLWAYLTERDKLSNKELFSKLCNLVNIKMQENITTTTHSKEQMELEQMENILHYAKNKLLTTNNAVKNYLLQKRKYNENEIKELDFGFISSQANLFTYLKSIGYSDEKISTIKLNKAIGASHQFLIALRNHHGHIVSFIARTIMDIEPKYLYFTGFKKNENLITFGNIKTDKIVLVEGILDAAIAYKRTGLTFIALGGMSLSQSQISILNNIKKQLIVSLDNDNAGMTGTIKISDQLSKNNLVHYITKPYKEKDPDEFLQKHIGSEFFDIIQNAQIVNTVDQEKFATICKPLTYKTITEKLLLKKNGIHTGYTIYNEELILPAGAISVFAAPTGHGKTAMLINLTLNIQQQSPGSVFFFSYEENTADIAIKMLNTFANLPIGKNNRYSIQSFFKSSEEEKYKYISEPIRKDFILKQKDFETLLLQNKININYVDFTIEELCDAIKYINTHCHASAIIIDYFQLLTVSKAERNISRQEELKRICIQLKNVAVETGLPIVIAAQFNREVKQEDQMSPIYIGEAGDIERIANLIIGIWNRSFESWEKDSTKKGNIVSNKTKLGIKILKNRDGINGGSAVFDFNGNTGKISNDNGESM